MLLILYNTRKFEKRSEIVSFKIVLNQVLEWVTYYKIVLGLRNYWERYSLHKGSKLR